MNSSTLFFTKPDLNTASTRARAHAGAGRAFQPHGHHLRAGQVVGLAQQLFDQLRPAFAHAHDAQGAVAGVAVRTENHATALSHHFAHILVDDRQIGGHKDAAVLARGRQAEEVVIFVDGAAHGTEAVVAVGEGVRQGKFLKAAGPCGLDNAHIGDVVGGQSVEADAQHVFALRGRVMRGQNARGQGVLPGGVKIHAFGAGFFGALQGCAVNDHGVAHKLNHGKDLLAFGGRWRDAG